MNQVSTLKTKQVVQRAIVEAARAIHEQIFVNLQGLRFSPATVPSFESMPSHYQTKVRAYAAAACSAYDAVFGV